MDSNTYKIKQQKFHGSWAMYIVLAGVVLCFVNFRIAICVSLVGLILMYRFKSNPDNLSAFSYNLALKHYHQGQLTKVKGLLKNSINYNKMNKDAYFFLGCVYFDEKDYTNALNYLTKGGADKVNDPSLVYVLGRCHFHVEQYSKAIEYLTKIEYAEKSQFETGRLYTLGKAYFEMEEYQQAVECFDKIDYAVDELKGESLEYSYYLGITYYYVDRDSEAKDIITKVFEADKCYKNIDIYAKEIGLA